MSVQQRLKELRAKTGLSQYAFSERINVAQGTYAQFETGRRNIKGIHIAAICREFNINEEWLRNGEGEMFKEMDVVDQINMQFELTEIQKIFVQQLMALSPEKKKVVDELILGMYNALKEEGI